MHEKTHIYTTAPRILIADDDPEDLELIAEAFLAAAPQAELHTVSDGLAAVEYVQARSEKELPCLVILDYNMPRLNGPQALSAINAQPRCSKIPKIVLSTSNTPANRHEAMKSGATDYITKPSNMNELNKLAERLVALCRG